MATYKVQQMAEVWYETTVEADNRDEAITKASDIIMSGDGVEAKGGFVWKDEFWTDKDD